MASNLKVALVRAKETRKSWAYEPADGKLTGDAPLHSALYVDKATAAELGLGERITVTIANDSGASGRSSSK